VIRTCGKNVRKKCLKKKLFKNTPDGKRSVGKPRKRWLDDVENYLKKIGVMGWKEIV
jgi:hypothetical protein